VSETPYNPLDKKNLGISVADAMLARPVSPLTPGDRFLGAGIYAIYYVGDFPSYAPVAERNHDGRFEAPIYVGKAIPLPVPVEEAAWASLPDPCCSED
jgi:hypothetical protein